MGVLSDRQIERAVKIEPWDDGQRKPEKISSGLTSYGYDVRLGYKFKVFKPYPCSVIDPKNFDQRMLEEVDLTPEQHQLVDYGVGDGSKCVKCDRVGSGPNWTTSQCGEQKPNHILIPPHSFVLGESVETFTIPRDILVIALGKSTLARCGLILNVTPGEPEWTGKWTIQLSNPTPLPIKVYCGEGVMQCVFLRSDEKREVLENYLVFQMSTEELTHKMFYTAGCRVSYADKKGRYQDQTGITAPFVEGTGE